MEVIYDKVGTGDHLLSHSQYDVCHFLNTKGRDPTKGSDKDEKLVIDIRLSYLDAFWRRELLTVRGNLTILRKMENMASQELVLEDWLPPLGPYPLKYEVGIGVACVTLIMSLRKGRYVGHPQWDSMSKGLTEWDNLYGGGVSVLGDTIYSRDGGGGLWKLRAL